MYLLNTSWDLPITQTQLKHSTIKTYQYLHHCDISSSRGRKYKDDYIFWDVAPFDRILTDFSEVLTTSIIKAISRLHAEKYGETQEGDLDGFFWSHSNSLQWVEGLMDPTGENMGLLNWIPSLFLSEFQQSVTQANCQCGHAFATFPSHCQLLHKAHWRDDCGGGNP